MTAAGAPRFAELLAPLLSDLSGGEVAAFLASLERAAATRYRAWAEELPAHAERLLACARSEDDIAARAQKLFPASAEQAAKLAARLPRARELFLGAFAGLALREQLALQAAAELEGAAAWRGIAQAEGLSDATRDGLLACAGLEEASAARLQQVLATLAPG